MRHNTLYTIVFSLIVCAVCGIGVSTATVSLLDTQKANAALDKKKNVLLAAGLAQPGQKLSPVDVATLFERVAPMAIDLTTGEEDPGFDLAGYDQGKAAGDPARSIEAPPNGAAVKRLPKIAEIYQVNDEGGHLAMVVLPIEGLGLWGTLYGFLAVDPATSQIRGITYYTHKETPGLGGEVDNPNWKARWPGRRIYREDGAVGIAVIKGKAGDPEQDPYHVDGLSGATITSNGVTRMLEFWLGKNAFGPYLARLRERSTT